MKKNLIKIATVSMMGVCTLGLNSFSALADQQTANTKVTYDAVVVYPEDWALSVPAVVNLDDTNSLPGNYSAINKIEITKLDGSEYQDTNYDHTFTINYTADATISDNFAVLHTSGLLDSSNSVDVGLDPNLINNMGAQLSVGVLGQQGSDENSFSSFTNINISDQIEFDVPKDGSKKPTQNIAFTTDLVNIYDNSLNLSDQNLETTIMWTATNNFSK